MYPLKFEPFLRPMIWGGEKIAAYKGVETSVRSIGESWELSGVAGHESIVAEGPCKGVSLPELIDRYGAELVGKSNYERFGNEFPLLVKFIDAREDLSIQVHPDDRLAWERHRMHGKTEMWYVLDCEPGAFLYYGFDHEISREELEERIRNNTLTEVLNAVPVKKGDCFFIPSGTLHAICKGVVVAEVQQNSNVTYRVYDYGRVGADGKPRALHVKQALEVMRRTPPEQHDFSPHLAKCDYFTVDVVAGGYTGTADEMSFVSLLITEGEGRLTCGGETVQAKKGDSFFITAGSGAYALTGSCKALLTTV